MTLLMASGILEHDFNFIYKDQCLMVDTQPWHSRNQIAHLNALRATIKNNEQNLFIDPFLQESTQQDGTLYGAVVSVKATFDVAGQVTTAGSKLLADTGAVKDAEAVACLRAAGASLLGHTNMTELAYSGVGLNPHYGTPAVMALGTVTGGSLRIPAVFCGVTGFKPSQNSVSRRGCAPLSESLDSVGPIAKTVATCRLAWQVLSGRKDTEHMLQPVRFIIPDNFGMDLLDEAIRSGFEQVIDTLKANDFVIEQRTIDLFEDYKQLPIWQFSAVESRRHYGRLFDLESELLDPRVKKRIARGVSVTDEAFEQTCLERDRLIKQFQDQFANTIFLLPTVACMAPKFSDFETDEDFDRINLLCLRNTTFANVIDGCSISLPFTHQDTPKGLMLTAINGSDQTLLALAEQIEALLP